MDTPIGPISFDLDAGGRLLALRFAPGPAPAGQVADRVAAYFAGDVTAIDNVDVAAVGTPFQMRVWRALREIRPGSTRTYAGIAQSLGSVARAIGSACAKNPVALVIPCHRVLGSSGGLTSYAWGVGVKDWLLRHEAAYSPNARSFSVNS